MWIYSRIEIAILRCSSWPLEWDRVVEPFRDRGLCGLRCGLTHGTAANTAHKFTSEGHIIVFVDDDLLTLPFIGFFGAESLGDKLDIGPVQYHALREFVEMNNPLHFRRLVLHGDIDLSKIDYRNQLALADIFFLQILRLLHFTDTHVRVPLSV